ncbi:ABC transporter substrate-binding protein [Jiangella mangrovi]|uniref:ABC-type nitrate/sulfonate/bicarbonate transport system substrate-binding protein n=1 Tax=Jiangella mangrovi TaxID=1524084 RepID=A0A7W9LNJ7_9ACTN|nr:ABC transporter substrate-binding protein [Jiangella mangrovi]MBB5790212.1 ABC-type nitrate/sulfonate/bicarbonate transport system substrate-binding protein [Jiangella mangrovi]
MSRAILSGIELEFDRWRFAMQKSRVRRVRHTTLQLSALLLATGLFAVACGDGDEGASAGAAGEGDVDTTPVVIAWNSTPDESYLPLLMAIDAMQEQGYDIEAQVMSGSDVSFQSLGANQIQFTADSLPPAALSVEQGAPIKAIGTRNANLVVWVAEKDFEDCADLDGEQVGIYSETGGYTVLMRMYFDQECAGVEPQYTTIPDSPLRAQAVAEGRIKGTALGLPDAVKLQDEYGADAFFVVPLRESLPGVGDEYVYTNDQTLEEHPAIVEALLTAQLEAIRSIYDDPDSLDELVPQFLPDAPDASVAKQFAEDQIWYANGGLGGPGLENTLEAFDLPGSPDDLQAPDPLAAVIDEISTSSLTEF